MLALVKILSVANHHGHAHDAKTVQTYETSIKDQQELVHSLTAIQKAQLYISSKISSKIF